MKQTTDSSIVPLPKVKDTVKAEPLPYRPATPRTHDLLHTKLEVRFDWQKRHLLGKATLILRPYFYPQDSVVLDAKGFDLHSIKIITSNGQQEFEEDLKYQYDQRKLTIKLGATYTSQQTYTLEVVYTAKPYDLPKGGSQAITADIGLYFINADGKTPYLPQQIWTQGEAEANSCWFPTIDSPNERCTQEMYITVANKFKTLSNGELVYSRENANGTRTDYWRMEQPHAPYLFMMAVGDFAVYKDQWQDKKVYYYVEKPYLKYAKSIFGRTPEMLSFFSKKLRYPFPWNKYAQVVVRKFVSGAMENTTASVFNEGLQIDDRALLDAHWDGIIAHELFHQWFGNLVTCESWSNLPLNEAFANYGEYLWAAHKYGNDEAAYLAQQELRGYLAEAETKQVPLIRYRYKHREDMFDAHSYNKGGRVLHMLRKYVGEQAFWRALNVYLTQNKYKAVEVHHLRLAFEQVTGQDLQWFFDQWFFRSGHPKVRVNHQFDNGVLTLYTKQINDSLGVFRLPLKVALWSKGKRQLHTIDITQATQTFRFKLAQAPDLVVFDAEQQLLGLIAHSKTDTAMAYQYTHEPTYKARMEVIDKIYDKKQLSPILEKTLITALKDKFWAIRQRAIEKLANDVYPQKTLVKNLLEKLAMSDPKTLVRASAIRALAALDKNQYQSLFAKGLSAKSYAVVGASLEAYIQTNAPDIPEKIVKFEHYKALEVVSVVANYYANTQPIKAYQWFEQKLWQTSLFTRHQLLQSFGLYLMNSTATNKKKGIDLLTQLIQGQASDSVKFLAYQSLSYLTDMPGVEDLLKKLKREEVNPELKKMYELVFQE
ncbi:M1 family metallopeptidase [uncultured Microscilla sp.]|uniref:M1 family metallopeptidase n=1 Tax=uncultured Microscilla sp. TaxID=432653 RepID=UPI002624DA07|nr:M1 family metallopeptidase [uncultured Microscilla sp.]